MYPNISALYPLIPLLTLCCLGQIVFEQRDLCDYNQYKNQANTTFSLHCGLSYNAHQMSLHLDITKRDSVDACMEWCAEWNDAFGDTSARAPDVTCNGVVYTNTSDCYLRNELATGQVDTWPENMVGIKYVAGGPRDAECTLNNGGQYTEPVYHDRYEIKCGYEFGPYRHLESVNGTRLADCVAGCSRWNRNKGAHAFDCNGVTYKQGCQLWNCEQLLEAGPFPVDSAVLLELGEEVVNVEEEDVEERVTTTTMTISSRMMSTLQTRTRSVKVSTQDMPISFASCPP